MFTEPRHSRLQKGWLEVICGSMFSGKTEELIRRLRRAQIAHQQVEIFKPATDRRYDEIDIVSHNNNRIPSAPVSHSVKILTLASPDVEVIGLDEAQFFDEDLPDVAEKLALRGIRVIAAGLDMDFQGNPFGSMPALLAKAEYITKLHAICMQCGDIANYSYRKAGGDSQVLLGETDVYEPRCRDCFFNAAQKESQELF